MKAGMYEASPEAAAIGILGIDSGRPEARALLLAASADLLGFACVSVPFLPFPLSL